MRAVLGWLRSWVVRWLRCSERPLGMRGEALAARYLRQQGCVIVGRAIRLRGGELDIVAVQERRIIFVEVKTRSSLPPGESLGEVITEEKERRITRAAYAYLKRHRLLNYPVRFDVITVLWPAGARPQLRHYQHAFEAAGDESDVW